MKALETLETTPEDEILSTGEDDEVLQDTDQMEDLTVSTFGLKESSDIVLETPEVLPIPQGTEQHPSPSTQTRTVLKIPTSEDYEAMMRNTIDRQTTKVDFRDTSISLFSQECVHLNMALIPCFVTI